MSARPIPGHGTRARYLRGCHCDPCKLAHSRYCKRSKYETHTNGPAYICVEPVLDHIRRYADDGWSAEQIAEAADATKTTIRDILNGQQKTITPANAQRILASDPSSHGWTRNALIPAIGFVRRGQALACIKHSHQSIAQALGTHPVFVARILNHGATSINAGRAFAMADLYESWSTTPGTSQRTATTAAMRGWHGPDAWDGADIDDPEAKPNAEIHLNAVELNVERSFEVQLLASAGNTFEVIAHRIGISATGVRQILRRENPDLYLELTA